MLVALRLNGVLKGGVSPRLTTPSQAWEEDVYGHIEVRLPSVSRTLRLEPVEWKPLRPHYNPSTAPPDHRNVTLWDRWLPLDINAPFGLAAFEQSGPGIAVPLPRAVNTFSEYIDLCADLWRCPDLMGLPPPPWAGTML